MNTLEGDYYIRGKLRADQLEIPDNSIGNGNFTADEPLDAVKQQHQYTILFAQKRGTAAIAHRETIHIPYGAGTLIGVRYQVSVAAVGDAEVTIDVLKNGTTVLTTPKVIDNALAAYDTDVSGIDDAEYVADDNFEVNITVDAGTGTLPQGLSVQLILREAAEV